MFTLLADHKATLNQLAELIEAEKICAAEIYLEGSYVDGKKQILDIASQKTGEEFIVLIIGTFACGKTSMINALIGENLLPTSFLPETAVPTELHYGKQKRITLYPKGGDEPFDLRSVTTEEIRKYVSLSVEDVINSMEENIDGDESQSRINVKFEKMVIRCPLDILKDSVVLVDTPGINNPYINDYIVNDYLPKADAIVYVMDSTKAYMKFDKDYLEKINALGHKNIITVYTFYDIVERTARRTPEKLHILRKTLINYMMKHTNLGETSIHFLDSMGGLNAKLDNDHGALRKSGFEDFENYLAKYFVEGKGSAQVRNMVNTIVIQADAMIKDGQLLNADDNREDEFKKRIYKSEERLLATRVEADRNRKNYRECLESHLSEVEQKIRIFLTEELPQIIDLEDFHPEAKKIDEIEDECQQEILRRMNLKWEKWLTDTLFDYMKIAAKESEAELLSEEEVRLCLKKDFQYRTFTVYGDWPLMIDDPLLHVLFMSRSLILSKYCSNVSGVLGTIFSNVDIGYKIKKLVINHFKKFFRAAGTKKEVDKMVSDIMSDVRSYVEKTCAGAEKILRDEVENTERLVRRMVEDGKATLEEKTAQIKQRTVAVDKLNNIKDKALQIGRDHGIRF